MTQRITIIATAIFALALPTVTQADDELGRRSTWQIPTAKEAKTQFDAVVAGRPLDEAAKNALAAIWPQDSAARGSDLLDQVAASLAVIDPQAKQVVEFCRTSPATPVLPKFEFLAAEQTAPFVKNNLRLYYGRWLAQHRFYDEALDQLAALNAADVVDPAGLLFYQAAGYHRLLNKERCLPLITKLLENEKQLPQRYVDLAKLMQADLGPLKADTLDEIARLMDEIERRLDHGRAGKKVRDQESDVIAKLDKMIEDLEKQQQQQQQQQSSGSGGSNQPSSPMQDSNLPSGNVTPGSVDLKKIGDKAGWGNLPPKERQEALQQISKDLPSHYREVIEEYFRKLARDGVE